MAYLLIRERHKPPERVQLLGTVTLGRAVDCDICLRDPALSVRHCCVEPADAERTEWAVVDLHSRNGTRMGNERIERKLLLDGETFIVGETQVQFHSAGFVDKRPEHPEATSIASDDLMMARRTVPSRPLARAVSPFQGDAKVQRIRPTSGAPRTIAFKREPAQPLPQATVDLEMAGTTSRSSLAVFWIPGLIAAICLMAWAAWHFLR